MAVTGLRNVGSVCRSHFLPFPLFRRIRWVRLLSAASIEVASSEAEALAREGIVGSSDSLEEVKSDQALPRWRRFRSRDLGISNSMVDEPARVVLSVLKSRGYEVYLVGGCVRDFILKKTPKDFDIITSANLQEVVGSFPCCEIVGSRFPICHVHINDAIVEVSSFSTCGEKSDKDVYERPIACDQMNYICWRNCLQRDYTINGLLFDSYANIVYDYIGGIEDIRKAKMRTIIPATTSFQEDCARILRGIRIAARLGFHFTEETSQSIKNLASSILGLSKGRLYTEMSYLLAFGSAENSLRLLWEFGLLEFILPIQAAYFVCSGFKRHDTGTNFLLSLLANMDKLLAPDRPCHNGLWFGILAFHKALSDHPRDPLVVATFCFAIYNGGDLLEALKTAKGFSTPLDVRFHELLEPQNLDSKALMFEVKALVASVYRSLSQMTDQHYVSQAMSRYPDAHCSNLVFIPLGLYLRACNIFDCLFGGERKEVFVKRGIQVDYELLNSRRVPELRYMLVRAVFDTMYPSTKMPIL